MKTWAWVSSTKCLLSERKKGYICGGTEINSTRGVIFPTGSVNPGWLDGSRCSECCYDLRIRELETVFSQHRSSYLRKLRSCVVVLVLFIVALQD